jgi:hypothetical protein
VFSLITVISSSPLFLMLYSIFVEGRIFALEQSTLALQPPVQQSFSWLPPILHFFIVCASGVWSLKILFTRRKSPIPKLASRSLFISTTLFTISIAGFIFSWNPVVPWMGGWTWQTTATALYCFAAGIFSYLFFTYLAEFIDPRLTNSIWPPLCAFSGLLVSFIFSAIGLFLLLRAGSSYNPPIENPAFQRMPLWQILLNCFVIVSLAFLLLWAIYFCYYFYFAFHRPVGLFTELPVGVLEIEDLPVAVEKKFRELDEDLHQEGFILLGCQDRGRPFTKWYLYSAFWLQPQMGAVFKADCESLQPDTIADRISFFLKTELSNGINVLTHQIRVWTFYDSPKMKIYGYDKIYAPLILWQLHRANVLRHSSHGIQPQFPVKGEEINYIVQRSNAELERWVKEGVLYRKNQHICLTFKGLLRFLPQYLWPFTRRRVQENKQITKEHLHALGLENWKEDWQQRKKQRDQKTEKRVRRQGDFV